MWASHPIPLEYWDSGSTKNPLYDFEFDSSKIIAFDSKIYSGSDFSLITLNLKYDDLNLIQSNSTIDPSESNLTFNLVSFGYIRVVRVPSD